MFDIYISNYNVINIVPWLIDHDIIWFDNYKILVNDLELPDKSNE